MRLRRVVGGITLGVASLLAVALGATSAGLRTERGRRALIDIAIAAANRALNGSLAIGSVSGSLVTGLDARDIVVRGSDGEVLVAIPRLEVGYGIRDLLRGRVVLGRLTLTSPVLNVVRDSTGTTNLSEVFGAGGGGTGPTPLVAFSNVEIIDGTVIIRDAERVRQFTGIQAALPYLRLATPFRGQPLRADVERLDVTTSDPPLALERLRGTAALLRDTLTIDLTEATLPDSGIRVQGSLSWATGPLRLDLTARTVGVRTDALGEVVAEVPMGLMASGEFRIRSVAEDVLDFRAEELDLRGVTGGGRARGRLAMTVGPGDRIIFRRTSLDLSNLDLEYVRAYFDTLPIAGRVTGRFEADGPTDRLELGLDLTFSDSLVPNWPATVIDGRGIVTVGGQGGLVFRDYELRRTRINLATVRRLLPVIDLQGFVEGSGRLNGPWLELQFAGAFRHRDPPLPESAARGSVRIDGRGDTLGIWTDVVFDSLSLDGLRSSYPDLPVGGAFGGRVVLAGYLDSLRASANLAGPAGTLDMDGSLLLLANAKGARDLVVDATRLDLEQLNDRLPRTSLTGRLTGAGRIPEEGVAVAQLGVALAGSSMRGVPIDSARLSIGVADSLLHINAFQLWGNRMSASGNGALGLATPREGALTLFASVDSIGVLEPMLGQLLGPVDTAAAAQDAPSGSVWTALRLEGSLDAFELTGELEVDQVARGGLWLNRAEAEGTWATSRPVVDLTAYIDSIGGQGWALGGSDIWVRGERMDSLAWEVTTRRFGNDGVVIAGGRLTVDSSTYVVPVDSMLVLLATGVWSVDSTAVVRVSDEGVGFEHVTARHALGRGEVAVSGQLPFSNPGELVGTVVGLPLQDIWVLLQQDYQDVDGLVGGSVRMSGTVGTPSFDAEFTLEQGLYRTFRAPYVQGSARYRDRRLVGEVGLWRMGSQILTASVELPVDLGLPGVEQRRLPGPVGVRASADSLDLSILELATPAVRRVAGTLSADFGITGTWDEPQLTGAISLRNGSGTIPGLGVRHENLNGAFRLSGDTIRIEHLSVRSGRGSAEATGFVRLEELSQPVLQLAIDAQDFHAVDIRDFLTLNASGSVQLRGPLFRSVLTGSGTVTEGVLYFADLVEKDVIDLEEFSQDPLYGELLDPELIRQQGLGAAFENRFLDSLRVDTLRLAMGGDVWLRSSEANIQLLGTVTVNKERDQYRLSGSLETPRGTYRLQPRFVGELITREFAVTRGELTYFGTPDLDAAVDIEARHVVRTQRGDNVTVFVHLGGTIYDPRLTLTSDIRPATSDAEIICYLFFSASCAQGLAGGRNSAQDQVVNQFLGALSGQAEYFLISDLRVPLDYLQIRPGVVGTGFAGTEIALGKRFGDRWFVTVSPRLCPREELLAFRNVGASLEYRFSRNWLLSVSGDPTQSCQTFQTSSLRYQLGADLFWEKSY